MREKKKKERGTFLVPLGPWNWRSGAIPLVLIVAFQQSSAGINLISPKRIHVSLHRFQEPFSCLSSGFLSHFLNFTSFLHCFILSFFFNI